MSIADLVGTLSRANLPSPEDFQKRKVALISGLYSTHPSTSFAQHLTDWLWLYRRHYWAGRVVSVSRRLDKRPLINLSERVVQDGVSAREGVRGARHHSSFFELQHRSAAPPIRRPA